MTTVRLGLDKWLDGEPRAGDVVGRIRQLAVPAADDRHERRPNLPPQVVVIPAGGHSYQSVDLEPGTYQIDAVFPSGEIASDTVTVGESGGPVEVRLRGAYSPHEWLSWQHLMGNIALKSKGFQKSAAAFSGDRSPDWVIRLLASPADTAGGDPVTHLLEEYLSGLASSETPPFPEQILRAGEQELTVAEPRYLNADGAYRSYVFPMNNDFHGTRWYLLLEESQQQLLLAVLPTPWLQSDHSGRVASADVLVGPSPQYSSDANREAGALAASLSIVIRDSAMATVIGYFGSGDQPAAATVLEKAGDLLLGKLENPLAAAAGAYVLLSSWRGGKGNSQPEWFSWIENLKNWFPWLPDGAIQRAWLALITGRPADTTRELFLEGFRRGIPYYSAGVQMLFDGLTLLAQDARSHQRPDKELEAALTSTQRLALQTDPRQPFTTIRLPQQLGQSTQGRGELIYATR